MHRLLPLTFLCCLPAAITSVNIVAADEDFPAPVNTQAAGEHPPSPQEMLDLFELPEGFNVTLFAGEPDVQQPIAFDFDDKGRIWVAENYTYSARGKIDPNLRDRVIILHDKDGDGEHDERKVFWDKGRMLTGLTWGYGGLWILNDGTLSFIADKNGDDIPDGEPVVMLNGWSQDAGHNFVNGLLWGPDGWLYGRHGILDTSYPGTPDTPKEERPPINCGIWRFHPVKHTFEVVCHGTTNPWGLDYNEVGDMFMSNNVIGHLWHVIPGAHYERMFGRDFNPHCYELMGPISDHYHWDETGKWSESRDGKADDLGGGHSHCGLMLYYGQNFPKEYRGKAFMCNTHGRCVNVDRIERKGSSYVAKHEPNFLKVNTPWFRGVELKYGPAGCVYLSDWSDNGECHDHDGVHRTSGRIYRISYGEPESPLRSLRSPRSIHDAFSLATSSRSAWKARIASRLFIEASLAATADEKKSLHRSNNFSVIDVPGYDLNILKRARLLAAGGILDSSDITSLILSQNEHLRAFGIRFAGDNPELYRSLNAVIVSWQLHETSPVVLREYATALRNSTFSREEATGFETLIGLVLHPSVVPTVSADPTLSLLTWYGLERKSRRRPEMFGGGTINVPLIRNFRMQRLASEWDKNEHWINSQLEAWASHAEYAQRDRQKSAVALVETRALLSAMRSGMEGQNGIEMPQNWNSVRAAVAKFADPELDELLVRISAAFGDNVEIEKLGRLIADESRDHSVRARGIAAVAAMANKDSLRSLLPVLNDRAVSADIARALAAFDDPRIPNELLKRWGSLRHQAREAAVDTMCSRLTNAQELATALDDGRVSADDLTATHVRQLLAFNDPAITKTIEAEWGVINDSSEAKIAAIAKWKETLTPDVLANANLENGAALFKKSCAACHKLYGDGGKIGPDLTGSNRSNPDYLLGNVIDPSAVVPKQFTASIIALQSGRIVTGVVVAETDQVVTVQTDKDVKVIAVADIDERTRTGKSLMPDGLLDSLNEQQVIDLLAFVMKRR